jgi:hypothetical protein
MARRARVREFMAVHPNPVEKTSERMALYCGGSRTGAMGFMALQRHETPFSRARGEGQARSAGMRLTMALRCATDERLPTRS